MSSNIEKISKIYNCDFVCEYHNLQDDTKYREEFLKAFNLTEYNEIKLISGQELILENIKHERRFERLLSNASKKASQILMDETKIDDKDFGLMVLFSFEYFYLFHNCLKSYINENGIYKDEFIENYNTLLKLLEKE